MLLIPLLKTIERYSLYFVRTFTEAFILVIRLFYFGLLVDCNTDLSCYAFNLTVLF